MKRLLFAALAIAAAAIAQPVPAASAHEGKAIIAVEAADPGTGLAVDYRIRVVWDNDLHPAKDATVTATGLAPDGTTTTPTVLAAVDADGRYAGSLAYPAPGEWTVRFTVVTPPGVLERPQKVEASATPSSTIPSEVTTTAADAVPATTSTAIAPTTVELTESTDASSNEKSAAGSVVFVVAIAVVIAGFAVVLIRGRKTR